MTDNVRLIKKYPNRRLYDTRTSSYITLADVKQLVLKQERFQVVDAKSGEDLTRAILLQVILEEESNGAAHIFSHDVLTQFIRSYGNAMQGVMSNYLERNLQIFGEIQKNFQDQSRQAFGDPLKAGQDMWTQFMAAQGPAMQALAANYAEQSKSMFEQMQHQMQAHAKTMFGGFPFPGFGAPSQAHNEPDAKKDDPQR
ncbi:MAG TPA: polyhydroxyalkanoate synthesis repressor PhaR [Burkholderiales bacterium]|nr:polyhydroxyalkanoate synthesis repressor PhaR [Burkholderiales bacterium]